MSLPLPALSLIITLCVCHFLVASQIFADSNDEESRIEVVVSASRSPLERKKNASSVTILTEEQIKQANQPLLADLLRQVSGLDVVRSGGPGGNTAVFLRGANSEHTLVLLDGVEINNPVSNARFFDFASLTTDNIERIEILRGPQSSLYGSDALGGVISIFTKRGKGQPSLNVSSEAGSYQTFVQRVSSSGQASEELGYSFAYTREDSDSISAADRANGNSENDGFTNDAFSAAVNYSVIDQLKLDTSLRANLSQADLDNFGGPGGDDPNRTLDNQQIFWQSAASLDLFEGLLLQKIRASYSDHQLDDDNDPDPQHPLDFQRSHYNGSLTKFSLQNILSLGNNADLIFGLETEQEKADSSFVSDGEYGPYESVLAEQSARTNGYFSELILELGENFATTLGLRLDDHSRFGSQTTYRIAPVYLIPSTGTKLTATLGSGFKAPSLYQLYSEYGNNQLEPEEVLGWDFGFEQTFLNQQLTLGSSYFRNEFDQLVTFDTQNFIFQNINEARTQGLESFVNYTVTENTSFSVQYTYTDTKDLESGTSLLRRARNKLSAEIILRGCDQNLKISTGATYIGKRFDNDFSTYPASRVELGSYTLLHIRSDYRINDLVSIFARVENVLDQNYQEVLGYGTQGAAAYAGLRFNL